MIPTVTLMENVVCDAGWREGFHVTSEAQRAGHDALMCICDLTMLRLSADGKCSVKLPVNAGLFAARGPDAVSGPYWSGAASSWSFSLPQHKEVVESLFPEP